MENERSINTHEYTQIDDTPLIRDARGGQWARFDHALIDHYAKELGHTALAVYIALCRYANADKTCFPSTKTIMDKLGIASRETLKRAMRKLKDTHLVDVIENYREDGSQMSNTYRLLPIPTPTTETSHTRLSNEPPPRLSSEPHTAFQRATELELVNKKDIVISYRDNSCMELPKTLNSIPPHSPNGITSQPPEQPTPVTKGKKPSAPPSYPPGFEEFWSTWPASARKMAKRKCGELWKRRELESRAQELCAQVRAWAKTEQWQGGFEPMPYTWLFQYRYDDDLAPATTPEPRAAKKATHSHRWQEIADAVMCSICGDHAERCTCSSCHNHYDRNNSSQG